MVHTACRMRWGARRHGGRQGGLCASPCYSRPRNPSHRALEQLAQGLGPAAWAAHRAHGLKDRDAQRPRAGVVRRDPVTGHQPAAARERASAHRSSARPPRLSLTPCLPSERGCRHACMQHRSCAALRPAAPRCPWPLQRECLRSPSALFCHGRLRHSGNQLPAREVARRAWRPRTALQQGQARRPMGGPRPPPAAPQPRPNARAHAGGMAALTMLRSGCKP